MKKLNMKRIAQMEELQKVLDYNFKDVNILHTALTHSSYAGSKSGEVEYNERLEFIGDSILNMIVSLELYKASCTYSEGQLTRMRANIVCEQSLYEAANRISLGKYILLSKGEENTGGRKRPSILADAFEALIASVYLDGGIKKAKKIVLCILGETISYSLDNKVITDYKSFLQEYIQKNNKGRIEYKTIREQGPDHNKTFEIALYIDDCIIGTGSGHSKKDAQQGAAKDTIEKMGIANE